MVPVVFLLTMNLLGLLKREDDHAWAQLRLSHYVEGDLGWRERKRLELHAGQCTDCSAGIRALRSLLRLMHGVAERSSARAPAGIFDRVRADAARTVSEAAQADEA
jgi:Putative zinc-finger